MMTSEMTVFSAGQPYTMSYFDRPGPGPAILYVHGLGCSKADFMEMVERPELREFRLLAADHPGCGDSPYDAAHPLNIDRIVELIENLVDKLEPGPFLLVGGSLGGLVGLLYAERNPKNIIGFANVEGNLAPEDCLFSRNVVPHPYSHFKNVIFPQIKKAIAARRGRGFARHLDVLAKADPRAYYDCAFQTVEYSDHGNLLQRFLDLPVPVCFLYGSENRHLSYLSRLRESACAVIEIPNANHFLFYDAPADYASVLASFVHSCLAASAAQSASTGSA
jgi:pimeloyl-ACP methyl ester carboxylesterase